MIITHMPTRLAVLTALVIAAALGAYYALYQAVGREGNWRVYTGRGVRTTDPATRREYFSVTCRTVGSGRWFEFRGLRVPAPSAPTAGQEFVLSFRVRTATGVDGFVTLTDRRGVGFTHEWKVEPTENWVRVTLPLKTFTSNSQDVASAPSGPEASRLGPVVLFGLTPTSEPTRSVTLELTRPRLERVVSSK